MKPDFSRIDTYYDLERSKIFENEIPLSLRGKMENETTIVLKHMNPDTDNQILIRFIFNQTSKDGTTFLTRYFESVYKLNFKVDLSTKSETEFFKIMPVVNNLINLFSEERERLSEKYDIFDLASLPSETLAREIINDFYLSSDISHTR